MNDEEEPAAEDDTPTPGSSQPPPSLPPRPASPTPSTPYHTENTMSMPNLPSHGKSIAETITAEEKDDDSASVLSTSSRSLRFKAPSLRRRATDTKRSRRASEALSEDDAASLGTQVGIEILGAAKEREQWGIGDEARMGLE